MILPTKNRISLVVLVKDEAADLRRLLAWHRDLYDEAVVVDTGSSDESVLVATESGARVVSFPWCDDFSAARNFGLSQARGDWVLILDCDELIAPSDFAAVRDLCTEVPGAWSFTQWNYCRPCADQEMYPLPAGASLAPEQACGYVEVLSCRLFPRRPDLRYQGVVHEVPDPSLDRAGVEVSPSNIVIHHYGHMLSSTDQDRKNLFYARMLRKKLQQNPKDLSARYEMAVQLLTEGNAKLAGRLLKRIILENPEHAETYRARLLFGRLLVQDNQPQAALSQMEAAVRHWPAKRDGWAAVARLHQEQGQDERAAEYIQQGRYLFPLDPVLQILEKRVPGSLADNRGTVG